ncbi:uncharacterized protein BHQ10_008767 [Talaromyces amestolkiae]|uniref:HTH araC/xylS-type domain-containing protein n=1 Tax=Talaromyces amestolkiae TaxID=1196081 RepID=A0A364LAA8_TALAM|nr:uncharacterized protein BHQ10_008767 [Talaromyces amestolkiae]RAO72755.1 hypothetical protein BHQ10_008767 [Talaromyces amestolkiae]
MSLLPPLDAGDCEASRWRIVTARDSNDSFVYAVRSTRIYCRPSCPSRLARRANVEFYDDAIRAEAAGYRPCKRCKPQLKSKDDPRLRAVERACKDISNAVLCGRRLKFQQLASDMKLSPGHLHRSFKKITGLTPVQYTKLIQRQNEAKSSYAEDQAENSPVIAVFENKDGMSCEFDFNNTSMYEHIDWDLIDWNAFDNLMESDFSSEVCDTVQKRA